jgi:hypothetical protein
MQNIILQPPNSSTPHTSKLQLRPIRHLPDIGPNILSILSQQRFLKRLSPRPIPPHHHLQSRLIQTPLPHIRHRQHRGVRHFLPTSPPLVHRHFTEHERSEIVGGVEGTPLAFFEAELAAGETEDGIERWSGEGEMGVVFCAVQV